MNCLFTIVTTDNTVGVCSQAHACVFSDELYANNLQGQKIISSDGCNFLAHHNQICLKRNLSFILCNAMQYDCIDSLNDLLSCLKRNVTVSIGTCEMQAKLCSQRLIAASLKNLFSKHPQTDNLSCAFIVSTSNSILLRQNIVNYKAFFPMLQNVRAMYSCSVGYGLAFMQCAQAKEIFDKTFGTCRLLVIEIGELLAESRFTLNSCDEHEESVAVPVTKECQDIRSSYVRAVCGAGTSHFGLQQQDEIVLHTWLGSIQQAIVGKYKVRAKCQISGQTLWNKLPHMSKSILLWIVQIIRNNCCRDMTGSDSCRHAIVAELCCHVNECDCGLFDNVDAFATGEGILHSDHEQFHYYHSSELTESPVATLSIVVKLLDEKLDIKSRRHSVDPVCVVDIFLSHVATLFKTVKCNSWQSLARSFLAFYIHNYLFTTHCKPSIFLPSCSTMDHVTSADEDVQLRDAHDKNFFSNDLCAEACDTLSRCLQSTMHKLNHSHSTLLHHHVETFDGCLICMAPSHAAESISSERNIKNTMNSAIAFKDLFNQNCDEPLDKITHMVVSCANKHLPLESRSSKFAFMKPIVTTVLTDDTAINRDDNFCLQQGHGSNILSYTTLIHTLHNVNSRLIQSKPSATSPTLSSPLDMTMTPALRIFESVQCLGRIGIRLRHVLLRSALAPLSNSQSTGESAIDSDSDDPSRRLSNLIIIHSRTSSPLWVLGGESHKPQSTVELSCNHIEHILNPGADGSLENENSNNNSGNENSLLDGEIRMHKLFQNSFDKNNPIELQREIIGHFTFAENTLNWVTMCSVGDTTEMTNWRYWTCLLLEVVEEVDVVIGCHDAPTLLHTTLVSDICPWLLKYEATPQLPKAGGGSQCVHQHEYSQTHLPSHGNMLQVVVINISSDLLLTVQLLIDQSDVDTAQHYEQPAEKEQEAEEKETSGFVLWEAPKLFILFLVLVILVFSVLSSVMFR